MNIVSAIFLFLTEIFIEIETFFEIFVNLKYRNFNQNQILNPCYKRINEIEVNLYMSSMAKIETKQNIKRVVCPIRVIDRQVMSCCELW